MPLAVLPRRASTPQARPSDPQHTSRLLIEMAHDLRSPLSAILVLAESLREGQAGPLNEQQRRQLGLIYSAALGLCTTASDVVELARGTDRPAHDARTPFSIAEVMDSVRDMAQPVAAERGLDLCFAVPRHPHRLGWPRALSRVLLNLVTNALKHTEHGSVLVQARNVPASGAYVEFSVHDTGPGMDEATLNGALQAVRQESDGRRHFSSAGLGLSICRRLVSAMGSRLVMESRPGHGTRVSFTVELPLDGTA